MRPEHTKIFCDEVYATQHGEEFSIGQISIEGGYVTIENSQGHEGVMALNELLKAIRTGEIVRVDGDESEQED
jgi:hypothetical protein